MFVQIGFQIFLGVFVYPLVCFRKGIVDYSVKGNIPIYQRFDREQRVVDAAQTPGRYQDNRQLLVGDVIDRQVSYLRLLRAEPRRTCFGVSGWTLLFFLWE